MLHGIRLKPTLTGHLRAAEICEHYKYAQYTFRHNPVVLFANYPGSDQVSLCNAGNLDDCKTFSSYEEAAAYQAQFLKKAKVEAKALPVDYEELVYLAVTDLINSETDPTTEPFTFYLKVFGDDPSEPLLNQFVPGGFTVLAGSEHPLTNSNADEKKEASTFGPDWSVRISKIAELESSRYTIRLNYSCGSLCAAEMDYEIEQIGDTLQIVNKKLLWIS